MKVAVIGSGGREHAIVKKLRESAAVDKLFCLPGNGGIAADTTCVNISAMDVGAVKAFCLTEQMDYVVVAPDDPLAIGMVDALEEAGIACFGPNKAAARIEASKVFSKQLMTKYGIPTAKFADFTTVDEAMAYICAENRYPVVIKADGLALGKGVLICEDEAAARRGLSDMLESEKFGKSGRQVVVEEFLTGPEVTVLAFCDGKTVVPMVSSMDHKRALDGDLGLNTGGMGVIAPNPFYTEALAVQCMEEIFLPTMRAMEAEGCPFKGCLYFGLMLTPNGPKVIEYNCRFGDPETQVVLSLLEGDLLEIFMACSKGTLAAEMVRFSEKAAACVVIASGGYPEEYEKGFEISGLEAVSGSTVYVAGAAQKDGALVSNGGRVLGVTAVADTLSAAQAQAYADVKRIHFANMFYRSDIGRSALEG
jgi:phosphoribosylamine--glycine ligase